MSMVERMARAVRLKQVERKELSLYWAVSAPLTEKERANALAALRAIGEPDEGMCEAACNAPMPMVLIDSISGRKRMIFATRFKAAINAAIQQAETEG